MAGGHALGQGGHGQVTLALRRNKKCGFNSGGGHWRALGGYTACRASTHFDNHTACRPPGRSIGSSFPALASQGLQDSWPSSWSCMRIPRAHIWRVPWFEPKASLRAFPLGCLQDPVPLSRLWAECEGPTVPLGHQVGQDSPPRQRLEPGTQGVGRGHPPAGLFPPPTPARWAPWTPEASMVGEGQHLPGAEAARTGAGGASTEGITLACPDGTEG